MGFFEYLIEKESVGANMQAATWDEALHVGGQKLIDAGCCTEAYLEAMVAKVRETGPYFVIAPGIAMPHTRPEDGATGTGFALVTLNQPVEFGDEDNDPISLLVFMAALDPTAHTEEAVAQIADFCDEPDLVARVLAATSDEEILTILRSAEVGE